ncbi:MAG: beta-galactosidase [Bacteroidia bacterium]|nr:beta-galactosidase [Bacteroidia bacterium]
MKNSLLVIISFCFLILQFQNVKGQEWKPIAANLMTQWASDVSPENVWKEYPRPQMVRDQWQNLNGLWAYAVRNADEPKPSGFDGKILVPFSIEAPLSGVGRQVGLNDAIWYQRKFEISTGWKGQRLLIHFEASDFETTVWLNGNLIGTHKGGYDPFSFDLTSFIVSNDNQELTVKVYDPQETKFRSLGKQSRQNKEYENCSGIWQTVWLEPVPVKASITSLKINPQLDAVTLTTNIDGTPEGLKVKYEILDNNKVIATYSSEPNIPFNASITNPKLWSPDSPHLYDLKVSLIQGNSAVDMVKSYFGLRTVGRGKTSSGEQFLLNGKPIFQIGPLDQNYWPDGGFTPPSDAAMLWEAQYLKKIGCNMVRLHIKFNPRRYYYHADRTGILIWQDFVCGQHGNKSPSGEESDFWLNEQKLMIETLYNYPSIVTWIVFNESWGQHDSERVIEWAGQQDKSRLIIGASGWNDVPQIGDIRDIHDYTIRPAIPVSATDKRILVLGECGGFASAVPPHNWTGRSNQTGTPVNLLSGGFSPSVPRDNNTLHDIFRPTFTWGEPFAKQYSIFIDHLNLLRNSGLCAAVYTQMTDMKNEENGWLTFDRKVSKVDEARLAEIHGKLFTEPPVQNIIFPPSSKDAGSWETAIADYPAGMQRSNQSNSSISAIVQTIPDFNTLKWTQAKGPFTSNKINPGSGWDGEKQIFIRKSFILNEIPENATVRVYTTKHEGVGNFWMYSRLYINGNFVADESTRQVMPESHMGEVILSKEAIALLKKGDNQIIIQFIPGYNTRNAIFETTIENVTVDISLTTFSKIE